MTTTRLRLSVDHRRAQIVHAARSMSYGGMLYDWNLDQVAEHVGMSRPGVRYYFGSDQGLRREIICQAVRDKDALIVVQALAMCDPLVEDISDTLRRKCCKVLAR